MKITVIERHITHLFVSNIQNCCQKISYQTPVGQYSFPIYSHLQPHSFLVPGSSRTSTVPTGKLLPSSVYISGRFHFNPLQSRPSFLQDPHDGTNDLGIFLTNFSFEFANYSFLYYPRSKIVATGSCRKTLEIAGSWKE